MLKFIKNIDAYINKQSKTFKHSFKIMSKPFETIIKNKIN